MIGRRAIFLSSGVPDSSAEHFMGEGDTAAISSVISALLFVALGRRQIVWGGHPAITPMVWAYAEALGVDYGKWVTLYQSAYFKQDFPKENASFRNVIVTDAVPGSREKSLYVMRRRMFSENAIQSAVFAGGMRGILDEYEMLKRLSPDTTIIPILSTGGASEILGVSLGVEADLRNELDYVGLLFKHLAINPNEPRGLH